MFVTNGLYSPEIYAYSLDPGNGFNIKKLNSHGERGYIPLLFYTGISFLVTEIDRVRL